jgi:hypothetical protein
MRPTRKSSFVRIPRFDKSIELTGQVYITRSVFKTPDLLGSPCVVLITRKTDVLRGFLYRPSGEKASSKVF